MVIAWSLTGACLFTLSAFKNDSPMKNSGISAGGMAPRRPVSAVPHSDAGGGVQDDVRKVASLPQRDGNVEGVSIVQIATGVAGGDFTTFRLFLNLEPSALNAYTIYGTPHIPLSFPPAYQCPAPFGVNIGGTSTRKALIFTVMTRLPSQIGHFRCLTCMSRAGEAIDAIADSSNTGWAKYDSWLTVGAADSTATTSLSSVGVPWSDWSHSSPLSVQDGGVFFMDPGLGPAGPEVLIAQLTVKTGASWRVVLSAQGRSVGPRTEIDSDWNAKGIEFVFRPG